MRKPIVISFMALSAVICMVTGCGTSSEAEETTAEEIIEETSEAEIEEDIEVIEAESEAVEEEEEEVVEETTETSSSYTLDEIKEALDPDLHMSYTESDNRSDSFTDLVSLDETATSMISSMILTYDGDESEALADLASAYAMFVENGLYTEETCIEEYTEEVQQFAELYFLGKITKDQYYDAILDPFSYGAQLLSTVYSGQNDVTTSNSDSTGTGTQVPMKRAQVHLTQALEQVIVVQVHQVVAK